MKSIIIILLLFGLTTSTYSQDKTKNKEAEGKMKMINLPGVVIKRIGTDFSIYLPADNPDQRVKILEEKFIAYDLGKDYEGSDEYLLTMKTKTGSLAATYNEKGKLVRVVENYKNVRLPSDVIYSIYKTYPQWTIVNDKLLYTQEDGDIVKNQYNVKIKKGKEIRKIMVRANGEIVKVK
jgi:hypothetical protein